VVVVSVVGVVVMLFRLPAFAGFIAGQAW